MAFVKKTWKDRISQYPNRRIINDGYVEKTVYVGRDEGTITQTGDPFNASNMNDLEGRIQAAINGAQPTLTPGNNISISGNVISVTDIMTANEARAIWNNA